MIDLIKELKENHQSYYVYSRDGNNPMSRMGLAHPLSFIIGSSKLLIQISTEHVNYVHTNSLYLDGKVVILHGCTYFATLHITTGQYDYDYTIKLDEL